MFFFSWPVFWQLGVDILWLMPVNPLGDKNRKGSLGSYYSVRDYLAVNPEYGTLQDFKDLVKNAHEMGMKVIIDWVANHTSWDNDLITQHPDWYKKDSLGNIISPVADWTDVAGMLPVSFWNQAIPEIRKIKPIFMLAEEETPEIHDTGMFDTF